MKIALLGDMALIGRYDREKSLNVDERLQEIRDITKTCDFVVANLESPLTNKMKTMVCKGAYIRSAPCNIETLINLGVTHVTLANNHIFDYGNRGKDDTTTILRQNHIVYVGLNHPPALLVRGDDRVLLDGFCCYSANGMKYGTAAEQLKPLSEKVVSTFIEQAKQQEALPIVSAHFGVEGVHYPAVEHRKFFAELSKKAAFVLHGNHPHAIQGVERVGDSLMIYAQGNLCFDRIDTTSIRHEIIGHNTIEARENLVAVIEVKGHLLGKYQLYGFSDYEDGFQRRSEATEKIFSEYSRMLQLSPKEYAVCRADALKNLSNTRRSHDVSFVLKRLSRKYIGAYLKGIAHAKKYRKIFAEYMAD